MPSTRTALACTLALGLLAVPAFAVAQQPTTPPGQAKPKPAKPAPPSSQNPYTLPPGQAYGVRCKGFSKKKVAGQKRTPFANCVRAMAQLDKGTTKSPAQACKAAVEEAAEGAARR